MAQNRYAFNQSLHTKSVSVDLKRSLLLGGGRVDDRFDFGNSVGREAALLRVFTDQLLVRRDIDTINLVAGDVTLDPLDFRAELIQNSARFPGNSFQLGRRHLSGAGDYTFDDVFGHG